MSTTVDTTPEQLAALAARPADTPIMVINLLQFRRPDGLQRYLQYGQYTAPHLARVGAKVRSGGGDPSFIIGEGEKPMVGRHHRGRVPVSTSIPRHGQ